MIILKKIKEKEVDNMKEKIEVMIEKTKNKNELNNLLEELKKSASKESDEITIPKFEEKTKIK